MRLDGKSSRKGRLARIKWDSEVEKIRKGIGGNQDKILPKVEGTGYKTKVRDIIGARGNEELRRN